MLKLWRMAAGLEPLRADCTMERVDGIDLSALIEPRMRAWYLQLLDTAPLHLLPVEDVARDIAVEFCGMHEGAAGILPSSVRRLLEIHVTGWNAHAVPCSPDTQPRRHRLALNPYSAPGIQHPLCSLSGRRLHMQPFEAGDIVDHALAVSDPGPESYILDDSLLSTIPTEIYNEQH